MVVRRNFQRLYRTEDDPWQIGDATSERYRGYVAQIEREKPPGGFASALDLGCGKGAFTAQLANLSRTVTGIELSEIAVASPEWLSRRAATTSWSPAISSAT
jgi:2-polyprenyl-3-methyl-5-hydroxy-6-metoxy-1,4-benzoquinol methylase